MATTVHSHGASSLRLVARAEDRPSHSTPLPCPVRPLPRRDALRSAHDKVYRSRSSAIAAAPVRHWQRGVILGAVLIGLVLGLVSASWTQLSSPMGVRSADAHSECGEPGLDSELCKLAYQGSLVTLLGY